MLPFHECDGKQLSQEPSCGNIAARRCASAASRATRPAASLAMGLAIGLTICLSRGCLPQGHRRPPHPRASVGHASFRSSSAIRHDARNIRAASVRSAARLEVPTPQRSDRFSLMPSHPASSPMTSGQDKIAPPQLTTSRARNGRSRRFPDLAENFPDTPI